MQSIECARQAVESMTPQGLEEFKRGAEQFYVVRLRPEFPELSQCFIEGANPSKGKRRAKQVGRYKSRQRTW